MSNSAGNRLYQLTVSAILLVIVLCMIVPFLYVLAVSFTDPSVYRTNALILWPEKWSLAAYKHLLSGNAFLEGLKASLFITVVGTAIAIAVTSTMAYMLSKPLLPGRKWMLYLVLFTMMFSPGMIPEYLLVLKLGLLNNWWSLILPAATNAWSLLVMRSFFRTIPPELEESAKLDGATDIGVFRRIVLPLSKAPLAAFTLFFAVGFWNTYFNAILYLTDSVKWPLQVILQQIVLASVVDQFLGSKGAIQASLMNAVPSETIKMATIVITMAPILLAYPFLQKHFAKGVLIGSVKG